jgi:hypothetical protein
VKISRIPAGLIGFLGIKNGGMYPQELAPTLLPTWDVGDLYLQYGAQLGGAVGGVSVAGYGVTVAPPPGEVWCLHDIGCSVTTGAGEAWTGALCRSSTSGGTTVPISQGAILGASANDVLIAQHNECYLCPGENLGLLTLAVTGTVDYYLTYRYTILTM